jgi:hypothetical protein
MDAKAVYVTVVTDEPRGDAGAERTSLVQRISKTDGTPTLVTSRSLMIGKDGRGGFVSLANDGTSLYAVEESPNADKTLHVMVEKVGATSADMSKPPLYEEKRLQPPATLRLLGAVNGAVLIVRNSTQTVDAGPATSEAAVIVAPSSGSTPSIVASYRDDTPIFDIQTPAFSSDVFWLNQSGAVWRLSAAALR